MREISRQVSNDSKVYIMYQHNNPTQSCTSYTSHNQTNKQDARYHLIATSQNYAGFDLKLMKSLKLIDATYTPHQSPLATCTFELLIDASYTNLNNVMVSLTPRISTFSKP